MGPQPQHWGQAAFCFLLGPLFEVGVRLWRRHHPAREVEPRPREHVVYFDVWRTICVALVVITHAHAT